MYYVRSGKNRENNDRYFAQVCMALQHDDNCLLLEDQDFGMHSAL